MLYSHITNTFDGIYTLYAHTTHSRRMHDMHTQCTHCMLIHTVHAAQTHMDIPHHVSDTQRNIHMSYAQSTHHTEYTHAHKLTPIHFSYGPQLVPASSSYLLGSLTADRLHIL